MSARSPYEPPEPSSPYTPRRTPAKAKIVFHTREHITRGLIIAFTGATLAFGAATTVNAGVFDYETDLHRVIVQID